MANLSWVLVSYFLISICVALRLFKLVLINIEVRVLKLSFVFIILCLFKELDFLVLRSSMTHF